MGWLRCFLVSQRSPRWLQQCLNYMCSYSPRIRGMKAAPPQSHHCLCQQRWIFMTQDLLQKSAGEERRWGCLALSVLFLAPQLQLSRWFLVVTEILQPALTPSSLLNDRFDVFSFWLWTSCSIRAWYRYRGTPGAAEILSGRFLAISLRLFVLRKDSGLQVIKTTVSLKNVFANGI